MKRYIRTWQMQPLPAATIAALTPRDVQVRFYDDRFEAIPFEEPTDLVAISVETYTARRAYQIASQFRRRGVPVVMGGFHATLCPQEVGRHCESVVIGEAEDVFARVLDDYRHGTPQRIYRAGARPGQAVTPDRAIFAGKPYRYLSIGLVEFARGCRFKCEFCAITSAFKASQTHRPIGAVIDEVRRVRRRGQMIFFIDDNITSDLEAAKALMRALIPERIRWVSQSAINVAYDPEALALMKRSGCQGILVGLESLDSVTLKEMNKGFNLMHGGPVQALANFRKHDLRVYGTFIFGYDHDTPESFARTVAFAQDQGLFIAAFNHITPFPGTPLYDRLKREGRLLYDAWWLDDEYRYNMIPFRPAQMSPRELAQHCVETRQQFYSWPSILRRATHRANRRDPWMLANYLVINAMHQVDVAGRNGLPLGDESDTQPLVEVG
ncbi:MAG: radical SAM protein [Phycisphaeraceae bacterium]